MQKMHGKLKKGKQLNRTADVCLPTVYFSPWRKRNGEFEWNFCIPI